MAGTRLYSRASCDPTTQRGSDLGGARVGVPAPPKHPFKLLHHEVDDFIIVGAQFGVCFDGGEGVVDDGEEHAHEADVHDANVEEEKERAQYSVAILELVEVETSQSECE